MIAAMKRSQHAKISLEAAMLYGMSIGLPEDEIEACYDHYEANGWMVGRVAMKNPEAALRNWKRNWQAGVYRNSERKSNASKDEQQKPASVVYSLKAKKEQLEAEMLRLRETYSISGPLNRDWQGNEKARLRHRELRLMKEDIERRLMELEA